MTFNDPMTLNYLITLNDSVTFMEPLTFPLSRDKYICVLFKESKGYSAGSLEGSKSN